MSQAISDELCISGAVQTPVAASSDALTQTALDCLAGVVVHQGNLQASRHLFQAAATQELRPWSLFAPNASRIALVAKVETSNGLMVEY
jgi:hypothetical protein